MKRVIENIFTNLLNIKPSEKILIVTDKKMENLASLFYSEAKKINNYSYLVSMEPRKVDGEEPPKKIANLMKNSDVILAITTKSLTHTKAVRESLKNGARIVSMPNIQKFSFVKGGLTVDPHVVKKLVNKIYKKVFGSEKIEVKSKNGTEVKFDVKGREWQKDEPIIHDRGRIINLPAGEVFVAPLEKSVNGKIVFDYFDGEKKVFLKIKNGIVFETNSKLLKKVFKKLKKARQVAEFGIGCNPKAKVIGNTLEDEKVFGTIHFALGNNLTFGGKNKVNFHKDGIVEKPTVIVDGEKIIENGEWLI